MILISNHLLSLPGFSIPADAVVRINMAWVPDAAAIGDAITRAGTHDVFLDYPQGRTKPPAPAWTIDEAIEFVCKHSPKYFAVSNVETVGNAQVIDRMLPDGTMFVPKIESLMGVMNLPAILEEVDTDTIMLDTEDLFSGCAETKTFIAAVDAVHRICKQHNTKVLRLYGVVFSEA